MKDPSAVEALKDEIATLKNTLKRKMEQVKQIGGDPTIEAMIVEARNWLTTNKEKISEDVIRCIVCAISIKKAKTYFDEASSDMDSKMVGANFDVEFTQCSIESEDEHY